jgi:hypothetical protein
MSYEPKPGSIAYRVLAYFETLPRGTELNTSQINEALGTTCEQLTACMVHAVEAGRIFRRKKFDSPRAPLWYSLTKHAAPAPPAPPAPATELPAFNPRQLIEGLVAKIGQDKARQDAHQQAPSTPAPRTVEEAWQQRGIAPAQPAPKIEAGPATKDAHGFRACLWTNGVLQIEREPGDLVLVAPPHVEAIRKLLTGGIA